MLAWWLSPKKGLKTVIISHIQFFTHQFTGFNKLFVFQKMLIQWPLEVTETLWRILRNNWNWWVLEYLYATLPPGHRGRMIGLRWDSLVWNACVTVTWSRREMRSLLADGRRYPSFSESSRQWNYWLLPLNMLCARWPLTEQNWPHEGTWINTVSLLSSWWRFS